ncbi:MAG: helix-turn-helix domain-containing protein [Canibacter sp.]
MSTHQVADTATTEVDASLGPQTVHRALEVLTIVVDNGPLPLSNIARKCGLPASTTMRMLRALEHWGYVVRLSNGQYSIGLRFVQSRVEAALPRAEELIALSGEIMQQLTRETLESSYLAVSGPAFGTCTFLREEQSSLPIRFVGFNGWEGRTVSSSGSVAGEIFESGVPETGYLVKAAVTDPDSTTIGAPVVTQNGATIAVLSIAGPSFRMPKETVALHGERVKAAALKLAQALDQR